VSLWVVMPENHHGDIEDRLQREAVKLKAQLNYAIA